jgi:predicted nucleic acid-binding protein
VRSAIGALRAIFDASVFVRALADSEPAAAHWVGRALDDIEVSVPSLVFAEVGNALAGYVRAARLPARGALKRLEFTVSVPRRVIGLGDLAPSALVVSLERGLSVYDACYAALAEAESAVLVTADRGLAAAVTRAELV